MKNSFLTVSLVLSLAFFFGFVLGLSFGELVHDRSVAEQGRERNVVPSETTSPTLHGAPGTGSPDHRARDRSTADDAGRGDAQIGATGKAPRPETTEETREVSRSAPSDPLGVEEGFLASLGKFLGDRLEAGTRNAVRFLPGAAP
ncbi:MAG: hypothetical protein KM296_00685 [Brockia lithotrophica]|nr:hypothetical protein [Brockia lithotrophica]